MNPITLPPDIIIEWYLVTPEPWLLQVHNTTSLSHQVVLDPIFLLLILANSQLSGKPYSYPSVYCLPLKPPGTTISPRRKGTSSTYNLLYLAAWRFRAWNSFSSLLSLKFSYSSSVQSVSSVYPFHLTRYRTIFHSLLNWLPIISSTSHPVWYSYPSTLYPNSCPSITIESSSGTSRIGLLAMQKGSIKDTWKALCIRHHEGSSSLGAVGNITFMTLKGPWSLASNFLAGLLVLRFLPWSMTKSPGCFTGAGLAFLSLYFLIVSLALSSPWWHSWCKLVIYWM